MMVIAELIGKALLGKITDKTLTKILGSLQSVSKKFGAKSDLQRITSELNNYFPGELEVLCFTRCAPHVDVIRDYPLNPDLKKRATAHRQRLKRQNRPNDLCATLAGEPNWHSEPILIEAERISFSGLCALREAGIRPEIISADALLICPDTEEVILHRRGARKEGVEAYPGRLHIFGGAYITPGGKDVDADRGGLTSTVAREILEESQAAVAIDHLPPCMMTREVTPDFGYVSFSILGLPISARTVGTLTGNWKGRIERIPFKSLGTVLQRDDWVPQGKALALAWLAVGAPNAKKGQRFGSRKAEELFGLLVNGKSSE